MMGEDRSSEVEWLRFFVRNVKLGPGGMGERLRVQKEFMEETGTRPPEGWDNCVECGGFIADGACVCEERDDP